MWWVYLGDRIKKNGNFTAVAAFRNNKGYKPPLISTKPELRRPLKSIYQKFIKRQQENVFLPSCYSLYTRGLELWPRPRGICDDYRAILGSLCRFLLPGLPDSGPPTERKEGRGGWFPWRRDETPQSPEPHQVMSWGQGGISVCLCVCVCGWCVLTLCVCVHVCVDCVYVFTVCVCVCVY